MISASRCDQSDKLRSTIILFLSLFNRKLIIENDRTGLYKPIDD